MTARMRQLGSEDGFTLVEVLIAAVLMIVVLGATLTALTSFQKSTATNQRQNSGQDEARQTLDLLARDLRNLASPVNETPEAVDRNGAQDLIFQSEGRGAGSGSLNTRNTQRVRFCLAGDGRLWRNVQTWTTATIPAAPGATECPGTGWTSSKVVAQNVVNGTARPIFTYNATVLQDITEVTGTLYVDVNPGKPPVEQVLQTSVYLRNQNRKPTALFSVEVVGNSILLNASESTDPEEKALIYEWRIDKAFTAPPDGTGILVTKPVTAGTHTVTLRISDGVLSDDETHTICVPAPAQGVNC
jgi:type II secretory pathway component PulJ